jgi:hypothetical protein
VIALGAGKAASQMVETTITATNGIEVSKNSDEFAGRFEYSAPIIRFTTAEGRGNGFALVAKIRRGQSLGDLNVQGSIVYSGDWEFYTNAVFKGGDAVDYKRTGGDVGSCRYGCTLTESFVIHLTAAQIKAHAENGVVPIQIRATKSSNTAILNIPVSYIDAVNEVAK